MLYSVGRYSYVLYLNLFYTAVACIYINFFYISNLDCLHSDIFHDSPQVMILGNGNVNFTSNSTAHGALRKSINMGITIPASSPPIEAFIKLGRNSTNCSGHESVTTICLASTVFDDIGFYNWTARLSHIVHGNITKHVLILIKGKLKYYD